ncbi:MAG: hypothetical protein DRQ43_09275 [Gammaproteobacteria bacterium]|nr:MAG: hypothetical protein DRQ43_09275 [Gammaproteobacteria bacterium]
MQKLSLDTEATLNIITKTNNTFNFSLAVTDYSGSAYDLTDHNAVMHVKVNDYDTDDDSIYSFITGSGLTISGSVISVEASAETMANEDSGSGYFYYGLKIHYPSGRKKDWVRGRFYVLQGTV